MPSDPTHERKVPETLRQISPLVSIKDDPERFVQKSVGNNLNDLYREAPERADFIISQWEKSGQSKTPEWIVRHGRRNQK